MSVLINKDGMYIGSNPVFKEKWCILDDGTHIPINMTEKLTLLEVVGPPEKIVGAYKWENSSWLFIGEEEKKMEEIPQSLTARQARLALHNSGRLVDVPAAIAGLPEPDKTTAGIEWEYATHIERNNPFVSVLAGALQLTDKQVDQLFIEGVKL